MPVRAVVHGGEAAVAAHPQLRRPGLRVPAVRPGPPCAQAPLRKAYLVGRVSAAAFPKRVHLSSRQGLPTSGGNGMQRTRQVQTHLGAACTRQQHSYLAMAGLFITFCHENPKQLLCGKAVQAGVGARAGV